MPLTSYFNGFGNCIFEKSMEYLSSVFYLNRLQILFVKNILRNDTAALLSFHFLILYLSRYFVMHGLYLSTENNR